MIAGIVLPCFRWSISITRNCLDPSLREASALLPLRSAAAVCFVEALRGAGIAEDAASATGSPPPRSHACCGIVWGAVEFGSPHPRAFSVARATFKTSKLSRAAVSCVVASMGRLLELSVIMSQLRLRGLLE
jgi:hypothetical protein